MRELFGPSGLKGFVDGTAYANAFGALFFAFLPLKAWLFWECVGTALFACLLLVLIDKGG